MSAERATTLRLIKSIDFTDSYDDVVLFDSTSQQYSYFASLAGKSYAEYSYQRPEAGYIKVSTPYDEIYDYAYLMFKNTSHHDKWWYAFIDAVEYINEKTTGIRFHIDIMQTYMFNYELGESFVVREHSKTDTPGDNLVPESLWYGDYEFDDLSLDEITVDGSKNPLEEGIKITQDDMVMVIAYNPSVLDMSEFDNYTWKENIYGGVYQGIRFTCIPFYGFLTSELYDEYAKVAEKIANLINFNNGGGVIATYMMPMMFLPPKESTWNNVRHGITYEMPTTVGTYTPKNKKLLTYPYVALNVTNHRDQGVDYAYEYFEQKPGFFFEGNFGLNPSSFCYPAFYKGKTLATEDGVTINGYPVCTYAVDGLTDWLSNHLFQTVVDVGMAAATNGASAYASAITQPVKAFKSRNPGMSTKAANAVIDASPHLAASVTRRYAEEMRSNASKETAVAGAIGVLGDVISSPPAPSGVSASDLIYGNMLGKRISIRRKYILTENAKRIDEFFDKYGYATNEVKTPDLKSRPYWNYIRLKGVHFRNIRCSMDVIGEITSIFEKGVTFWRANATIGDYTNQDNSL